MNVVQKIYADGRSEDGEWKMSLDEMQQFVGGYIEQVASRVAHRALIINEEGFYEHLTPNPNATAMVAPGTSMIDGTIRGNALLVKS